MAVAHDSTQPFKVDTYTCHAAKAMAKVKRAAEEKAEKSKRPEGWKDGLHYYVVPFDVENDEPPTPPSRPTRGGKHGRAHSSREVEGDSSGL